MNIEKELDAKPIDGPPITLGKARLDLFLISVLILFLELACIRWFPAHVLYLTFFTNMVLLACFLGMSLGCLAAQRTSKFLSGTPLVLATALLAGHGIEVLHTHVGKFVDVGNQNTPQLVYFGAEYNTEDIAKFVIPIEALGAVFFLLLTLVMVGPGQELGRAFTRVPNRVQAYAINILGSVVGIVLFAVCSYCQLSPLWWFVPIAIGLAYFGKILTSANKNWLHPLLLVLIVAAAGLHSGVWYEDSDQRSLPFPRDGAKVSHEHYWSPYYRIDYVPANLNIITNLMDHQMMGSRNDPYPAYALPHIFRRDAGLPLAQDVLIIGAGSGNDLSRALQWGAKDIHIDAVEIDPVIQKLGARDHPDKPYSDARVQPTINDGRNFLRSTDRKYDIIIYALVDSLVLHSSYANLRLESYLFTQQAFADARRCLKPGGMFIMYNAFRQGWLVSRLNRALRETFGNDPLVLILPYTTKVPEGRFFGYTMFIAGDNGALKEAFSKSPEYWVRRNQALTPDSPNGFTNPPEEERQKYRPQMTATDVSALEDKNPIPWHRFGLAEVPDYPEAQYLATDDWPFLYLRAPLIPDHSLRSVAIMGGIALLLLLVMWPRGQGNLQSWGLLARMFFLGAGFMLIETKAVVHMALLFGSTWMVNTIVFLAVLLMILAANVFVLTAKPRHVWPYYVGLLAALACNIVIPLDAFLGMDRTVQTVLSCLLVFTPILFAGIIFPVSFSKSRQPDLAFGINVAGAMFGGLAENASLLLGFQQLMFVAVGFYCLSALVGNKE
jgi:SAM-dependent methyltransferase